MAIKWFILGLAMGLGLVFPGVTSAAAPAARPAQTALARQLVAIINRDRQANGKAPLHATRQLALVALKHSLDMAAHGYFSHYTLHGASPFDRMDGAGIRFETAGENIGLESGGPQTEMLQRTEDAMLNSPGHRANLLRSTFTRVGIGIAVLDGRLYITEDFTG